MKKSNTPAVFWQNLDQELVRSCIWGQPAEMLKQELHDHFQTEKESLQKQGKSEAEAEELALRKLGSPAQLAQAAQAELYRRNGRFFSMLRLRLMMVCFHHVTWFALTMMISFPLTVLGVILQDWCHYHLYFFRGPVFEWILSPAWLTSLAAFVWLLRRSFNPAKGWNYLLLTSAYLAFIPLYWDALLLHGLYSAFGKLPTPTQFTLLHFPSCFVLLLTPWLVRAWKTQRPLNSP